MATSFTLDRFVAAASLALMLLPTSVQAARPSVTDDARIVDAKACQLETWLRFNRGSTEYWAQPACNFTGKLELTFGGALTHSEGRTRTSDVVLQGKTVFKPLETNDWGWGLAVGHVRHPNTPGSGSGDWYAYVPLTLSLRDDRVFIHANVGWLSQAPARSLASPDVRIGRTQRPTWGLGTEVQLAANTWWIGETFQQGAGRPFFQTGVRHWLVKDRLQLDATVGNRLRRDTQERWFSIGLRVLTPAFLP